MISIIMLSVAAISLIFGVLIGIFVTSAVSAVRERRIKDAGLAAHTILTSEKILEIAQKDVEMRFLRDRLKECEGRVVDLLKKFGGEE
jgi:5-bromo-4-chloroindolyl phosphate hydrolysis protein